MKGISCRLWVDSFTSISGPNALESLLQDTYWLVFTGVWSLVYIGFQLAKPGSELNEEPKRYDLVWDPQETRPVPWTQEQLDRI